MVRVILSKFFASNAQDPEVGNIDRDVTTVSFGGKEQGVGVPNVALHTPGRPWGFNIRRGVKFLEVSVVKDDQCIRQPPWKAIHIVADTDPRCNAAEAHKWYHKIFSKRKTGRSVHYGESRNFTGGNHRCFERLKRRSLIFWATTNSPPRQYKDNVQQ